MNGKVPDRPPLRQMFSQAQRIKPSYAAQSSLLPEAEASRWGAVQRSVLPSRSLTLHNAGVE